MRTDLHETAVESFEQVRPAVRRQVAELGHGMQGMSWGCPPYTAGVVLFHSRARRGNDERSR